MIRTLISLLPPGSGRAVAGHLVLTVIGVALRAVGAVLLVPLVAALFSDVTQDAWPWLGLLAADTAVGWVVDRAAAVLAFRLGFGLLDTGQRTVADRIATTRLTWFTADTTATTRH
ncbi:MAG TPA: iron ABC transporter permease, partial [Terrimesophilobacter sp.]|nr:iron ABC transporter permease [Terrimesophilobacter sp.]